MHAKFRRRGVSSTPWVAIGSRGPAIAGSDTSKRACQVAPIARAAGAVGRSSLGGLAALIRPHSGSVTTGVCPARLRVQSSRVDQTGIATRPNIVPQRPPKPVHWTPPESPNPYRSFVARPTAGRVRGSGPPPHPVSTMTNDQATIAEFITELYLRRLRERRSANEGTTSG